MDKVIVQECSIPHQQWAAEGLEDSRQPFPNLSLTWENIFTFKNPKGLVPINNRKQMAPIKAGHTAIDYIVSACVLNKINLTYYSVQAKWRL